MQITFFHRPTSNTEVSEMKNISTEDEEWFKANNIKLSIEDTGVDFILYADCCFSLEDHPNDDLHEMILSSKDRTCLKTMSDLRKKCEEIMKLRTRFGRDFE